MYVAWRKRRIGGLVSEGSNAAYKGNGPEFRSRYRKELGTEKMHYDFRPPTTSWRAELVTSTRVEGTPRQRYIAYLGTIDEDVLPIAEARRRFWRNATNTLALLRQEERITAEQQTAIEEQLAARVERSGV